MREFMMNSIDRIGFSRNAGIDNALKMREMFITTTWLNGVPMYWAKIDLNNTKIKLEVGACYQNGFRERTISTYYFNEDGTYYRISNT